MFGKNLCASRYSSWSGMPSASRSSAAVAGLLQLYPQPFGSAPAVPHSGQSFSQLALVSLPSQTPLPQVHATLPGQRALARAPQVVRVPVALVQQSVAQLELHEQTSPHSGDGQPLIDCAVESSD